MEQAVVKHYKNRFEQISKVAGEGVYGLPNQSPAWDTDRIGLFFMQRGKFGNAPIIQDTNEFNRVRAEFLAASGELIALSDLISWESANDPELAAQRVKELEELPQNGIPFHWGIATAAKIFRFRQWLLQTTRNGLTLREETDEGMTIYTSTDEALITADEAAKLQPAIDTKTTREAIKRALKSGLKIFKETGFMGLKTFQHNLYNIGEAQAWLRHEKHLRPLANDMLAIRIAIKILIRKDLEKSHLSNGTVMGSNPIMIADEGVCINPLLLGIKDEKTLRADLDKRLVTP